MEAKSLYRNKLEPFLLEALKETENIVSKVEERYRDAAFPVILQSILKGLQPTSTPVILDDIQDNKQNPQTLKLPSNLSVNEFFRKAAPDSHPIRFVCGAYYLLNTGKTGQFTTSDILDIYIKLRQPKPANPADVINKCIRKAHFTDAPSLVNGQKSWVITPEGERYVEEELLHENTNSNSSASR